MEQSPQKGAVPQAPPAPDEALKLRKELQSVREKAEEYLLGWKRAKADFANYQRDVERRAQRAAHYLQVPLIEKLLPLYESLEHAIGAQGHARGEVAPLRHDGLRAGIQQVKSQFERILSETGVERLTTMGTRYDPATCEVVERRNIEGVATGTILEERSPGYTIRGRILKPAKVVVAE